MSGEGGRAEIHPFDVNALGKGDWITPDQCERVLSISREHKDYDLKLLALAQVLERHWREVRDEQITLRCEDGGIRILTDDGAIEENLRRFEQHKRGMGRALVRQSGVDRSKVTSQELLDRHERGLVVGAAFLASGRRAARAALRTHRRSTPGLPKKE